MNKLITLLVMIAIIPSLFAQQDPLVSVYPANIIYYMPATTGRLPFIVSNILFRRQWGGLDETPSVQLVNIQLPFSYERMGAGFQFVQESSKNFRNNSIKFFYAYKMKVGSGRFSAGVEGGLFQQSSIISNLRIKDEDDDILTTEVNRLVPDIGLGLFYWNKGSEFGVSVKHLNNPQLDNQSSMVKLRQHLYLYGSHKIVLNSHYFIKPYFLTRYVKGNPVQADVLLQGGYSDILSVGAGLRTQHQIVFQGTLNLHELINQSVYNVILNYSYDFAYISGARPASQEVMITVNYRKRPDPNRIRKRNRISSPLLF